MNSFINKIISGKTSVFNYTIYIITSIVFAIIFWSLDKGLGFSDEAYFLMHLKDIRTVHFSNWQEIFKIFHLTSVFDLRIITIFLSVISALTLSFGTIIYSRFLFKYETKISFAIIFCLSLLGQHLLIMPTRFVPNYSNLSIFILNTTIGLAFILISLTDKKYKYLLSFVIGALSGLIPFIYITNIPFIILIVSVIFIHYDFSFQKLFLDFLIFFIAGLLFSALLFFNLFLSFSQFIQLTLEANQILAFDQSHGFREIFHWLITTFGYFNIQVLIPALAIFLIISSRKINHNKAISLIGWIAIGNFIFYLTFINLFRNYLGIFSPTLFIVFYLILFFKRLNTLNTDIKSVSFFCLLIIIPFLGPLGTNVDIEYSSSWYMSSVFIGIYLLMISDRWRVPIVFETMMVLAFISFLSYPVKIGWAGYKIIDQTEKITPLGYGEPIYLDKERIKSLEQLKKIVKPGSQVIISSPELWGYVFMLNYIPPYVYYEFNKEELNYILKNPSKRDQFYYFEDNNVKFPDKFIINSMVSRSNDIDTIRIDDITIYKYKNID